MLKLKTLFAAGLLLLSGVILSQAYAADSAVFVSQSAPTSMIANQTYTVSVTMRNNGTTTWTKAKNYRLGSQNPADNKTWGLNRVLLSDTDAILPGQSKTFTFSIKAPAKTGNYNFQWKMVRDGVGWFGARSVNLIIPVTAFADNAQFISQSVPTQMAPGLSCPVSVTMKNLGTTPWTAGANYKLGSQNPQNNTIWGISKVALASTDSIGYGKTKTFTFTVKAPSVAGTYNFQWRMMKDGTAPVRFGDYTQNVAVSVKANSAPVLSPIGNKTVNEGQMLTFTVSATDPDGNALTYSASNLPSGAAFNPATRTFSWTPSYTQAGTYSNVTFTVSDGSLTDYEAITITVNNVNRAPDLVAIGNKIVDENQLLQFTVSASDPDGNPLACSVANLPQGASFVPIASYTGVVYQFSWTPSYTQSGSYYLTFIASDGTLTDSEAITITVIDVPTTISYLAIVDDHDTAMPTEGQYYNYIGGDRGMLNANYMTYSRDSDTSYKAKLTSISGLWQWGGMWYSLLRDIHDNIPLDFKAIFGPYVKPEYQGEITEVQIKINSVSSPTNNTSLKLRLELKDATEYLIASKEFTSLTAGTYTWVLPDYCKGKIKTLLWILDYAKVGDAISVDKVVLKAKVPDLTKVPSKEQAFLWTFSWLMNNYDPLTGMVEDRSGFESGDFENVSATGKTAKVVYYAYKKGYITYDTAKAIITKIADTLIYKVPRGPSGINTLWPHFTRNGGTEALPPHTDEHGVNWAGSEWASGDTAYAALDVIAALQMLGDPNGQMSLLENYLKGINWSGMLNANGYISFGYLYEGSMIPYAWDQFGMETVGVNWAYASSTGNNVLMPPPPTYNGSGFIDNAQYPMVLTGTDQWGNDWDAYRNTMADTQINWYSGSSRNAYLTNSGLFGLSAGETPEADGGYQAYGVGGKIPLNDGNSEVLVLHYPGMISDIRLQQATHMWELLRNSALPVLQSKITISPLNNMESMRVNKTTGKTTINHLKGSWNLALQAEGWALADPAVKADLAAAITNNAFLKSGYDLLKQKKELWLQKTSPGVTGETVSQIKSLNNCLLARSSAHKLYKSSDLATIWQPVGISLNTGGYLTSMDVDQGKLYISTRNGIMETSDLGTTFKWSFYWDWDSCVSVDMQNGYGWAAILNWGSMSGPIRKTPTGSWTLQRGDIPWSAMSANTAVADTVDPYNICYLRNIGGYRTLDSGLHWTTFPYTIIYTANISGKSFIYRDCAYSEDHGDTWKPLGVTAKTMIRDEATGIFFVAPTTGGIYVGQPGAWHDYGLPGEVVHTLSICAGKLVVVTSTGKIYSTKDDISTIASLYK